MKQGRKTLSLLLVLAMMLSLLPGYVLAKEEPIAEPAIVSAEDSAEVPQPRAETAEAGEGVAIDEMDFPDANFRAYVSENCDTDRNGYLSEAETAAVTWIDCSCRDIVSLEGIKYFTALEYLDCSENQLTALNMSGSTALGTLSCALNQLETLDVSGCTALGTLSCPSNLLTALDMSGCTALTSLVCNENRLTALDVSDCPSLWTLSCGGNDLAALDVRANTMLTELECFGNLLTTLDVSENTELTYLDCSGNELTALNVRANTSLRTLDCSMNPLSDLALGQMSELKSLTCYGTGGRLTSLIILGCPYLVDACENGTKTEPDWGDLYEGPLGGKLYVDAGTGVVASENDVYLWLGGTAVHAGNCADILGDGSASYDPNSRTLTFTVAEPDLPGTYCPYEYGATYAIYSAGDLTIAAPETGLTLNVTADEAVYSGGALTVKGDVTVNDPNGYGLHASGDISVDGNFTGLCLFAADSGSGNIRITGDVTIHSEEGSGLHANAGITVDGSVIGTSSGPVLDAAGGDITVRGDVDVTGLDGGLDFSTIYAYGNVEIFGAAAVRVGSGGTLIIADGSITLHDSFDITGSGDGLRASGDITVDGNVIGTCDYFPLKAGGSILVTGDVDLVSTMSSYIISASQNIEILGNASVRSTAGESTAGTLIHSNNASITLHSDIDVTNVGGAGLYAAKNITVYGSVTGTCQCDPVRARDGSIIITGDLNVTCSQTYWGGIVTAYGDVEIGGNATVRMTEEAEGTDTAKYGISSDAGTVKVVSGTWDIRGNVAAIYAGQGITIPDTHEITVPAGGKVDQIEISSGHYYYSVVKISDLSAADHVVIEPKQTQPAAQVYGCTLSLDGDIGVNFYVVLPDEFLNDPDAYITLNTTRLTLADAKASTMEGQQVYKWKYRVAAKRMADEVVLNVYNGAGEKLNLESFATGEDFTESGYSYSVRKYIQQTVAGSSNAKLLALVKAMSDYGSKAQAQFKYNASTAAAIYDQTAIDAVTAETVEPYRYTKTESEQPGLSFMALTLVLESETTLKLYFKVNEGEIGDYSFVLDGRAVTPTYSKGYYMVEIKNIAAKNLDKVYTLTVSGSDGVCMTLESSALSYACQVLNAGGQSASLVQLVKALYLYNQAANAYFEN